jgi:hypothetical protein
MREFIIILIVLLISCKTDIDLSAENSESPPKIEMVFNQTKWKAKEGSKYLYRDRMLNDVVYNDTIRLLDQKQILSLLGSPTRINENYYYYLIKQKRIGSWPLHTKSLVIKFTNEETIEWIKIHGE